MAVTAALPTKGAYDVITLAQITTAGAVSSTNTTAVYVGRPPNAMVLTIDLTAAATDVGDTLDVKVQTILDGTNWTDVAYFTQMLGNGGAKRYVFKLLSNTAEALFTGTTALTAGNQRNLLGDAWRINYVVVDANANSAFTFTVSALPM